MTPAEYKKVTKLIDTMRKNNAEGKVIIDKMMKVLSTADAIWAQDLKI